jgi:hypothetical protein
VFAVTILDLMQHTEHEGAKVGLTKQDQVVIGTEAALEKNAHVTAQDNREYGDAAGNCDHNG